MAEAISYEEPIDLRVLRERIAFPKPCSRPPFLRCSRLEISGKTSGLSAYGSPVLSFNPDLNNDVRVTALQSDGKVMISGDITMVSGQRSGPIARLNVSGNVVSGFNPNASDIVTELTVQPDGKVIAGGIFDTLGGQPRSRVARLSAPQAAL